MPIDNKNNENSDQQNNDTQNNKNFDQQNDESIEITSDSLKTSIEK
jgi:hypothetical protein